MIFNSFEFVFLFLPISLFVYYFFGALKQYHLSVYALIFFSIVFYQLNAGNSVYILCLSGVLTFFISTLIRNALGSRRKVFLWLGVGLNLLLLGYYKYTNFIIENINSIIGQDFEFVKILFPLGISFITFQQIIYLVDSYEKLVKNVKFTDYLAYLTFFPKIISGPIVGYEQVISQLKNNHTFKPEYQNLYAGAFLFLIGMVKKVVIADNLGIWVNAGYSAERLTFL